MRVELGRLLEAMEEGLSLGFSIDEFLCDLLYQEGGSVELNALLLDGAWTKHWIALKVLVTTEVQTPHQSEMQTASRLFQTRPQIVADQQTAAGVRLSVSVADQSTTQMSGLPAELRALELLADGKSNRQVLEVLRSEELKLDRNKLKRLRAEAKGIAT